MNGLVVMISGKGSLLQAILNAGLPISAVISDRDCPGLCIAKEAGIPISIVMRKNFGIPFDRIGYTHALRDVLLKKNPKLVAMAGFKTVLDKSLFEGVPFKIINIHPSLLPSFPGNEAVRDTIAYGAKISGFTIHYATPVVDHGPILVQAPVSVLSNETEESLHERIKKMERELYPLILKELLNTQARA